MLLEVRSIKHCTDNRTRKPGTETNNKQCYVEYSRNALPQNNLSKRDKRTNSFRP